MIKKFLRSFVRRLNDCANKYLCTTYGDAASMFRGPCERCVGHAVTGPSDN